MVRPASVANIASVDPRRNVLLGALPDDQFGRIAPALEPVNLPRAAELEAPDEEIEFVSLERYDLTAG